MLFFVKLCFVSFGFVFVLLRKLKMDFLFMLFLFSLFSNLLQAGSAANDKGSSALPFCSNNNPCLNNGRCLSHGSSYMCDCPSNCEGGHCEHCSVMNSDLAAGVCSPNPCQRDCLCHESCQHSGGYYCRSSSGYLGKNCTIPVPTLRCEMNRIVFSVSESFVREYDLGLGNSYINIVRRLGGTQGCEVGRAVNGFYEIQIPIPFNTCGTELTSTSDSVVFTNQMWFNRRLANSMFDMPIPVAEFQCTYERQYRLVTSLRPILSTPTVIGDRQFITPSISLCKIAACPSTCPINFAVNGGAMYTVGEMIHVTMELDSGNQVTGVDEMYLSCSLSPSTSNVVGIVQDGCGTTSGLPCEVTASAVSNTVCVSFQTPRSLSCQEFYIHAKLTSCDRSAVGVCPSDQGVSRCTALRGKRSVDSVAPAPVVLGPIMIVNGSVGIPRVRITGMEEPKMILYKPDKIDLKNEQPLPSRLNVADGHLMGLDQPYVIIIVASGTVLLVICSVLLIMFARNRSNITLVNKS